MFSEIAEKVFQHGPGWAKPYSNVAKHFVDIVLCFGALSSGSVYIVFISNNFHDICNYYFEWTLSVRTYICIVMVPIILIGQIRVLKYLTPFSGAGNALILAVFGIVLYNVFQEPLVFKDRPLIVSYTKWPMFFRFVINKHATFIILFVHYCSSAIYAMNGIGVIMPVENTMKHPQRLLGKPSILLMALGFLGFIYLSSGFLGFARFGDSIKGSITLNLPSDQWTTTAAQALIGIAIFPSFAIIFFIAMEILMKKIENKITKSRNLYEFLIRTAVLLFMGTMSYTIPDIGLFISLVGGFSSVSLGFIVPILIETVFLQSQGGFGTRNWKLWKNALLMIFSLTAMVTATYLSVKDVIESFK